MNPLHDLVAPLRAQFPSLKRTLTDGGPRVIYLDGPAGSQVPQVVIEAISNYYNDHNANSGGKFATSQETNQMMAVAHQAAADWFGAENPQECIFGANMTTLTFAFSRALARTWNRGDRIVVSQLDHDANVTPWKLAAQDAGVEVSTVRVHPEDATLDIDDFKQKVSGARLVAFTCASNSVGTRPPVRQLVELAHAGGAEVYLDAVHYAPHDLIDVRGWDADYCVCSAYKFFGPHVGLLWGRQARLAALTPYKLRPAPAQGPGKWMTGTQNFAAISGVVAAIDYIAAISARLDAEHSQQHPTELPKLARRPALRAAFAAVGQYERQLLKQLLQGLAQIEGIEVYGITALDRLEERVPTVAFNLAGRSSAEMASLLAEQGIFCWHGDYYAVDICQALGQQPAGMVRLGILHTTTTEEIQRTLDAITQLAHHRPA